jgi:hypothetical protein
MRRGVKTLAQSGGVMQYPSKKAKRNAKYRQREIKRKQRKDEQALIDKTWREGSMEDMAKIMGVPLK